MTHDTITDTDRIRSALSYIDAADRDVWLRMGMAIKAELGEHGFDAWDAWGQTADNYSATDSKTVWRSIRPDGKVGIGSLFHEAKQRGWQDDGRRHTLTPAEIAERQRAAAERAAADAAEIERERAETAAKAAAILKAATAATGENPYLLRKQVPRRRPCARSTRALRRRSWATRRSRAASRWKAACWWFQSSKVMRSRPWN
jgi:putative DNA primase/helicase